MSDNHGYTWRDHPRLFIACGVVILSPFQYGFDFGMIGGLQAMVGFLEVFHYDRIFAKEFALDHKSRFLATVQTRHLQDGISRQRDNNSSPHS
jgi:hypothetical protein